MGLGASAIITNAKKEQSGPPFALTSAYNGLSVDNVGKVVLGQNVGAVGNPAALISNRQIPLAGFSITHTANTLGTNPTLVINNNASISYTDNSDTNSVVYNGLQTRTGVTRFQLRNLSNGVGSASVYQTMNDVGADFAYGITSSLYTALGFPSNVGRIDGNAANGLFINSRGGAAAGIYLATNGAGVASISMVLNPLGRLLVGALGSITPADNGARLQIGGNATISQLTGLGGVTVMTALLHIAAGTAAAGTAPIKLTSGTNLTAAETGAIEYDGTNLFFTPVATRENVFVGNSGAAAPGTSIGVAIVNFYGTSATNFLGDPDSWASVVLSGTTYKIPLYL